MHGISDASNDDAPLREIDGAKVIDINNSTVMEPCLLQNATKQMTHCRRMPGHPETKFRVCRGDCLAEGAGMTATPDHDIVIFTQGIWEAVGRSDCVKRSNGLDFQMHLLQDI